MSSVFNQLSIRAAYLINCITPKKENGVIFYSSPDYSDNCRAIFEKMIEFGIDKDYDITWVVKDTDKYKNVIKGARVVKYKSFACIRYLAKAKYIIRTHGFWGNRYVKGKQIMCVAFHGVHVKGFTPNAEGKPRNSFDFMNVTSPFWAKVYSDKWNADLDRFVVTGLPRDDYMFAPAGDLVKDLGLDKYSKRIIWMPTFRISNDRKTEGLQSEFGIPTLRREDLKPLNDKLAQKDCCLILKLHPWAVDQAGEINLSNIKLLKNSDIPEPYNLYHLIGQMDAMLSDYSSAWLDFLMLDRPVGFAFDDLEEYMKIRTMVLDPFEDYLPGMRIRGLEDIYMFIDSLFEDDKYIAERKRVRDILLTYSDAHNTERFMKAIGLIKE